MQPYFFPYQGYFQLIAAVDKFVVYDDVCFIKNGWINRNRILAASGVEYLTVPLAGASSFRQIRETKCAPARLWRDKMLRRLSQSYARCPERDTGLELVQRVLRFAEGESIRDLAVASIQEVCGFAGIHADVLDSSSSYGNAELTGVQRVLDICRREGATAYVNLPGGRRLYEASVFAENGIDLRFVDPKLDPYPQYQHQGFVPGLSVLDLVMNVPQCEVAELLRKGLVVP
jgi:hypothetical protein